MARRTVRSWSRTRSRRASPCRECAAPDDADDQPGRDGQKAIAGDERGEAGQRPTAARCTARAETGHPGLPPCLPPPWAAEAASLPGGDRPREGVRADPRGDEAVRGARHCRLTSAADLRSDACRPIGISAVRFD